MTGATKLLWAPDPARIDATTMHGLRERAARAAGHPLPDYEARWQWAIDEPRAFWSLVWHACDVVGERGERVRDEAASMPGARCVADRLAQVESCVPAAADGHRHDGKLFEMRATVGEIAAAMPRTRSGKPIEIAGSPEGPRTSQESSR